MMLCKAVAGRYRGHASSNLQSKCVTSSIGNRLNRALYSSTSVLSNNALARGPSLSPLSLDDQRASNSPLFQHHQVRWKRKGGASAFSEPRPPTRKQRKAYNRRKAKLYHEKQGKHSAPGSKAGYRRQWNEETFQQLLDYNSKNELMEKARLEYDYGDAMVDDLMGNTAGYTSLPTPKPFFLGHRHKKYYNQVRREMERYREGLEKLEESSNDEALSTNLLPPSDHDISLVLRAYRDRHGTKTKPIGIVKALKHLLTDLSLNTALFGEETYTTLLTCCQTPAEARRIFKLMTEQQHPISSYSWAILVDIHAKLGDFEGCNEVMNEMVAEGGLIPSLPAYTSLLAACYKVVNNGTIPHSIRDKAAKLGWNRWKEMFISDIEPDAMAYGALLRLIGARGQPERAINILQEMQSKGVKPTTLCFTSALKAVSRSQQTAVRFERGSSKKQKRREQITAHHGKLARQIVILAENAEVKQDDGFVAALMLCAGAAGDSATAKAILLASEVRKMNHLRTIGPDDHLRQIRGESTPREATPVLNDGLEMEELLDGAASLDSTKYSSSSALETRGQDGTVAKSSNRKKRYPSFEEREYGADSRKLSALLFACSQAVDSHSLGMQWAGRYNKGYLDENSLRLITTRPQPKYFNPAIPGVSSTEVGMGSIAWQDEEPEHLSKSLRRAKYRGINQDDSVGHTMEDIDDTFFNMFKDDYKEKMDNIPEVDPMLLNKEEWEALKEAKTAGASRERMQQKSKQNSSSIQEATYRESDEEWYFDDDSRKWKARKRTVGSSILTSVHPNERKEEVSVTANDVAKSDAAVDNGEEETEMYFDDTTRKWKTRPKLKQSVVRNDVADDSEESELYFDEDARRWKTRSKSMAKPGTVESPSALETIPRATRSGGAAFKLDEKDYEFQSFVRQLKDQIKLSGDEIEFDENEARELFALTRGEFEDENHAVADNSNSVCDSTGNSSQGNVTPPDFETFLADIKDEWDISETDAREMYESFDFPGNETSKSTGTNDRVPSAIDNAASSPVLELERAVLDATTSSKGMKQTTESQEMSLEIKSSVRMMDSETNAKLAAIQEALPGLPLSRAKKVVRAFEKSLNYPSMLELVPILRENMPDHLTTGWLKRHNIRNAEVALQQAEAEGLVDVPIMNGALQVKTSAGSLDEALAYHEDAFEKNGVAPTAYSDRLVLQMLVRNNRLSRALAFKQKVEEDGRHLDVISYGTLIEHYGNHGKLGSAMLVLKECLQVHGAPPGSKSLAKLRLLCRQNDMESKLRLEEMIGKDPMEWLRHGEANLKREMSFKGRRDINLARNRMVQA